MTFGAEDQPLLGALIRMPLDAIQRRMLDDLHQAGFADLVNAHSAVLRYPGPEGRRPSELAAEAGMSRQAMNYLLGELEQMGYLVRRRDPLDRRSRRIELTRRGRDARQTMRTTVSTIEDELGRDLRPARLALLKELLAELNRSELVRRFRTTTGQAIVVPETTPATRSVRTSTSLDRG